MAKIACPKCGNKIDLVDHPRKPGRVVGYCACGGSKPRAMIEYDAPGPKVVLVKPEKPKEKSASGQPRTVEPDPA